MRRSAAKRRSCVESDTSFSSDDQIRYRASSELHHMSCVCELLNVLLSSSFVALYTTLCDW